VDKLMVVVFLMVD